MILRLLKNDLMRGKLSNFVMLLFIMISATLSCASVNLIYSSTNQISYFMNDMGNVADLNYSMMNVTQQDKENVEDFLKKEGIQNYQIEEDVSLPLAYIKFEGHDELKSSGVFATTSPKYYNFLFDEDNEIPTIKEGYVGIPLTMKEQLDLQIGENFTITRDGEKFTYKIQCFVRDSIYGSEMVGQKRILLHPKDYEIQYASSSEKEHTMVLSIKSAKGYENLEANMQKARLPTYISISKDTSYLSFLGLSIGTCAILMMSGVILLCMSFLIIRYTILFQMENNYAEIGVMKAIGLRHSQIRSLYMAKYLGLGVLGSILGFFVSIPASSILKEVQAGVVPVLSDGVGVLLSAVIVVVILCMVYGITALVLNRLKKQSTMDAIRKGNEGESYKAVSSMELRKIRHMPMCVYLAVNELFAHMKNTVMMISIYAFCLLLILLPLTLKDSFRGNAFLDILKVSSADLFTRQYDGVAISKLEKEHQKVVKDLKAYDEHVSVRLETMTSATLNEGDISTAVFMMKRANRDIQLDSGKRPILENEVAVSSTIAKQFDKTVGDSITISCEGKKVSYLITGIYTSMMNLGSNVIVSDKTKYSFAYNGYMVINFSGDQLQRDKIKEKVLKEYDGVSLITSTDLMTSFSGDMPKQISSLSDLMTVVISGIVFALIILFSKMQMLRSKKSIALLQSIGYHRRFIRRWQTLRCLLQVGLGLLVGLLVHTLCTSAVLEAFFKAMGMGKVNLVANPIHAYILYPCIYLCVACVAQWMVNQTLQKWNVKELNDE
ncbi:FtsX-like permease family protein [Amedibacillus sp. YH-ame6]